MRCEPPPIEIVVELAELLPEAAFLDENNLEIWLDELRIRLKAAFGDGTQPIRVRVQK